ncbi:MAG TPA: cysteine desulfurase NifS [Candidatus Omnitrophica bacterium]|nr:cysteine desulfurase NifS [Candidatus Omnitrophota bacterium]
MVYLDYNATTPLDKRILEKMILYLKEIYSNPSSIYKFAQEAKGAVEEARAKVADLIFADVEEIIFTSGGTESNNTAIKGVAFALKDKGKHIITSKIEHHAVLNPCKFLEEQGFEVTYLNVDEYGVIDLEQLKKSIRKDTILVSVMYANNEVGTIQPIKEIAQICKEKEVYFHTDAVQAVGKIPVDVKDLGVDLLSLSSHKLYGPKGVGALYVRRGVKFAPLLHGGYHERSRRAGTENVAGIVGLGEAVKIAKEEMLENEKKITPLRNKLEEGLRERIPEIKINGHPIKRLYNTLNVCIKYIEGESILINLDFEGICASSGSACTSGSLKPSHVLLAMGISHEIAHGSLRFSLGKYNTEEDIDKVLEVLPPIVEKLRRMSPFWRKERE